MLSHCITFKSNSDLLRRWHLQAVCNRIWFGLNVHPPYNAIIPILVPKPQNSLTVQNHLGASFWPSQGLEGWQLCAWLQAPKSRRRSQEKLVQQLDVMTSYKWLAKQYYLPRWKEGQKHIFDPSKINTMELERVKLWALSNGFLRPWKVQRSWVNFQTEQGSTQRPEGRGSSYVRGQPQVDSTISCRLLFAQVGTCRHSGR